MTIARRLADFSSGLTWEAIPDEVRRRAKHLMLDAIGCGLAAKRFDFAAPSLAAATELGGAGKRVVLGHAQRLPLRDAVMANGILMHGLDYDDTHSEGVIHLTVATLPTALGMAAELGRSGRDLLVAYVAGLEAGARLGAVAKGGFHQVGFHPTGLVGAFCAAIAAGKLRGLNADQLAAAQGITLSVASGSLEFLEDGAWTKRLHPGWAGVSGITAATLAGKGFVAPGAAYEGRFGLYKSHLGTLDAKADYARATQDLGRTWETMNIAVKPFPACHFVHAFADAAIALGKARVDPDKVQSIQALVAQEVVKTVCEPVASKKRPANDYDAKFSVPFAVASGLRFGSFGLAELEEKALRDPATLALAAKVDYQVDPKSGFPRYYSGEVIVRMKDGAEHRHREAINRGNAERPLTNEEVVAKYQENSGSARIKEAVLALDKMDAEALEGVLADG